MIEYTYDSNAIEGSTLTLEETALVLKENIEVFLLGYLGQMRNHQHHI